MTRSVRPRRNPSRLKSQLAYDPYKYKHDVQIVSVDYCRTSLVLLILKHFHLLVSRLFLIRVQTRKAIYQNVCTIVYSLLTSRVVYVTVITAIFALEFYSNTFGRESHEPPADLSAENFLDPLSREKISERAAAGSITTCLSRVRGILVTLHAPERSRRQVNVSRRGVFVKIKPIYSRHTPDDV